MRGRNLSRDIQVADVGKSTKKGQPIFRLPFFYICLKRVKHRYERCFSCHCPLVTSALNDRIKDR